jgi:predicted ATPase
MAPHFLTGLRRKPFRDADPERFPWTLPLVRGLRELEFTAPVTFLVGENGAGKSTLLEGLAAGMGAVAAGARDISRDPSLRAARDLAEGFHFIRRRHARIRLFLRAEDVFGYTGRLAAEMADLGEAERELAESIPEGHGRDLATGVARGQRRALESRYGTDPDARSHGETFLALLGTRLVPQGLYFLDEPETPLSPTRQLALLALLAERVGQGCQFVIATHSPILTALPGAAILLVEGDSLRPCAWDDLEHVRITRAFLNNPDAVLRQVLRTGT